MCESDQTWTWHVRKWDYFFYLRNRRLWRFDLVKNCRMNFCMSNFYDWKIVSSFCDCCVIRDRLLLEKH